MSGVCSHQHIVLVGMMGAGKSSVGRVLAQRLERELHDSDHMIEARDGREALEKVQQEKPTLAILDIVMPELDGYAVVDQLQHMGEPFDKLPILFLTCVDSNALELLGDKYGAYLRKPVNADRLLKAIDQHLPIQDSV